MYLFVFSARIDKCGYTSAQKFFKFSVWSEPHHIVKCMDCSIQTRHSLFRPQGTSSEAGVSILAGNGKEGTGKGRAKFASFMQPSGLCSELDCNLMLCDSQLEEGSIITGLQGGAEFLSAVGKMYRSFGIHKKHSSLVPLPADKYEANIKSVADYIKSSVDEVKLKGSLERTPQMARMEPFLPRQPPLFKCFLMASRS